MPEFIQNAGRELPFVLLLIVLLGVRLRVTPRARLFIKAAPETVFRLLDFREGDSQRWQRTRVSCRLVDAPTQTYELSFVTPLATGATQ